MLRKFGKIAFVIVAYPFALLLSFIFGPNGGPILFLRDILKDNKIIQEPSQCLKSLIISSRNRIYNFKKYNELKI